MGKVLGLDIGISSVGWGIIDTDKGEVVDAGVRLFTEAAKENNEKRRGFRGSRRLKRRKVNRKDDLIKVLSNSGLYEYSHDINPLEARIEGLSSKLTNQELTAALLQICKHRGSSLEVVEDEETKDEESTKAVLAKNDALIKSGSYVCQIQKERLDKDGKIRGVENNFRSKDYKDEVEKILSNQDIGDEVKKEIIDIIFRRRHFSDGPGSFISQSIYGRVYDDNGNEVMNMIQKMTGKCSIFPDEYRAPKKAPSAEFFNLLNDLNNLSIDEEPIDITDKQELVKIVFEKGSITPKQIAKFLNVEEEDIKGFRIDKDQKTLVTKLEGFKEFKKIFEDEGHSNLLKNFDLLDQIAKILTDTKVESERIEKLSKLDIPSKNIVERLSKLPKFTNYHSLSLKAINLMNEELYNTTLNQMQILTESNKLEHVRKTKSQKGNNNIAINDKAILSPVAMRAYRQAIKVVNCAREKYGEFDSVVVETTRDKNSSEQKKRINDSQKYFENINKKVKELLEGYKGVESNSKLKTKIRLYMEQDGKTAYTQETIDLDLLIRDPYAYEIDHIIPISISLDDSINNKALVSRTENQNKGQFSSPLMAFNNNKFPNGNIDKYKAYIRSLLNKKPGISLKKYSNYMYAKDITKYENMKDFIARNLVDTSYANRLVFNTLMDYYKDNDIDTKVHTIKGAATSAFRKRIKGLEKDRDKDYSHHAIDALIVASIKKLNLYNKLLVDFSVDNNGIVINNKTGEIIECNDNLLLDDKYMKFLDQLIKYNVTRFSHQIDTKPNRSIADQTIYSTRIKDGNEEIIKAYRNIYDPKEFHIANDIINGNDAKYLVYRNDKKTYQKLKDVVDYYYNEYKEDPKKVKSSDKGIEFMFNPFAEYKESSGRFITKYSKKDNGPNIVSLKYADSKLGNHVDISQNYNVSDKKVVLLQISPYRTDFYLDDGIYKFVTVRYSNIKYIKSDDLYEIDEDWYRKQLGTKNISDNAKFCFSMHHNEYIEIEKDGVKNMWKFIATNNDTKNIIEVKSIDHYDEKRIMPSISKNISNIRKFACTPLGDLIEIKDSILKLRFK